MNKGPDMNIPREKLEQWLETLRRYVALDQHQDRQSGGSLCQTDLHRSALAALSSIEAELEQPQQPVHFVPPVPTESSTTLLPCPFCGAAPTVNHIEPHEHVFIIDGFKMPAHAGSVVIECACGAGLIHDTEAAVRNHWNSRAVEAESGRHGSNKTEPAPSQPQGEQSTGPIEELAGHMQKFAGLNREQAHAAAVVALTALTDREPAPESPQAAAQPCDMGELCIGCTPRNADGSCPGAAARWTALEPVAWQVWWGIGEMRPAYPPFRTRQQAEESAACIKSHTEVRPLYATPSAAMALLGEALRVACDHIEMHKLEISHAKDAALIRSARARIDALTGTGRKEQSNG